MTDKPTKATAPDEIEVGYLTPGKTYDIIRWDGDTAFYIKDDNRGERLCLPERCAHISNFEIGPVWRNWVLS